ncbi:MAG TPA: anti-sigma factor [Burkholderiales bacterium]
MDCTESRSRLHAYLDQELDLPSVVAIDQHLASCAACKTIFTQQSALQVGIRKHAVYHEAPAGLAERIRAQIGGTRAKAPRWTWRWQPLQLGAALAATALVSWTAAIEYSRPRGDELIIDQVMSSHARSVMTSHLADVASSDQHTVKPWLSSKLDFSPPATDLTGAGFPLVGGRVDYVDHRPVAALVYRHREHVINVFVWPERNVARTAPMPSASRRGYNVVHWTDSGLTFWAISDLNAAEMKTFAETYAGAS